MEARKIGKEEIHRFLQGSNDMKYIIKIEGNYRDDKMSVIYYDENGKKKISHEAFYPFCWAKMDAARSLYEGDRKKIARKLSEYQIEAIGLRVNNDEGYVPERMANGYRIMFRAKTPMSYQKFLKFFQDGGKPLYSDDDNDKKEFICVTPVEQFMIETGKRLFKGYDDYDELLRSQFDLETEGLDPQKDAISQIGIRNNRGLEKIITVEGEGEEKLKNEIIALREFFETIRDEAPDILSGHNTENFDWNFINERLKLRGTDLEEFTKKYFPHRGIYKSKKEKVLKLGGEMEYYFPTVMWGVHLTDSLFAVRRAQAINSNIKKADLKYITKFAKLNKENRVYVPGKIINDTWADTTKTYAHNDKNGHWFKITDELKEKKLDDDSLRYVITEDKAIDRKNNEEFEIVTGKYIVERYLLDDLYETDKVELSFNQTNFQICKMLPVSFEKMCTMGTAAIWKYIMLAWSYENGLAIPQLIGTRKFTGGLSRLLVTGYSKKVIKLDYNSLYPSIILTFLINSDIDITGVMISMLEYILTKREEYKSEKKNADKKVRETQSFIEEQGELEKLLELLKAFKSKYALFDNNQGAVKVIGNGFFGSYGSGEPFPWSDLVCAEKTTCIGRMALRLMIGWFTDKGYKPLVGDTDGFNFQMPDEFRYTKEHPYIGKGLNRLVKEGKEYVDEWGDIMEFNDLFMRNKMGLDEDEVIPATINFSRKNYCDLLDNGEVKLVGNSIKSKKMPIYIEKFLDKGIRLLLENKGKEFLEFYYDYVEKIYNLQIPLKDIASVGKIKTSIANYKENCKQLTAAGTKKSRQAWYELAISNNLNVDMGDAIYYINTGTKKNDSDVKRITEYFAVVEGKKVNVTKELERTYTKEKKKNPDKMKQPNGKWITKKEFGIRNYGSTFEDKDRIVFNCILLDNKIVEDEDDHFCDEEFEYNVAKYIEMFNKRIKPLLVCFSREIRSAVDEKGKEISNILISNPKDRKAFTEDECKLISGQPYNEYDQDTYEALMTMEDKEIKFWLSIDEKPPYIDDIGMDWEEIKSDYKERKETEEKEEVKKEIEEYEKIIDSIKKTDVDDFIENGVLPDKLKKLIDEDFNTGVFISKKWNVKLGTIYDIIDKDFEENEVD